MLQLQYCNMKKLLLLPLTFFLSIGLSAQLMDDFEDADLNSAPQWDGMISAFTTSGGRLKSAYTQANSVFYISTSLKLQASFQWTFDAQLLFNTSSLNYVDAFLMSDSANLLKSKQGLFVRMGGSTDEVSLFKLVNGIEYKLIDGLDAVLNTSNNQLKIRVLASNDSIALYRFHIAKQSWILEGVCAQAIPTQNGNHGLRIRQSTSSFFGKHYFDNWYAGPIPYDTISPAIDSISYNADSKQLILYWNELLDSLSACDTSNFCLNNSTQHPNMIELQGQSQVLKFLPTLTDNQYLTLTLKNVRDLSGNICDTTLHFFTLKKDMPLTRDLLITELLPDPDPVVDLPPSEFVEVYNASTKYLHLKNCKIADPGAYRYLPDVVLAPDSFLVLSLIPSLNNAADIITLYNPNAQILDQVAYDETWYADSAKSKGGYSLERIDCTNFCKGKLNWCASKAPEGGTPGRVNSVDMRWGKDTVAPSVTLFNPIAPDKLVIDLDEMFDSVNQQTLQLYIGQELINYEVLYQVPEQKHIELLLPKSFTDTGKYHFSVAGFKDCPGNVSHSFNVVRQFVAQPKRNSLVINEVLFNPKTGGHDFIELFNRSNKTFDASQCFIADLRNGIPSNFYPISTSVKFIPPGTYCLLSDDTAEIARSYHCGDKALKCQMKLPALPDAAGQFVLCGMQGQVIDSLSYSEDWHFSLLNDKNGVSLERLNPDVFVHIGANWHSAAAVNGFATPGYLNSQTYVPVKSDDVFNPVCRTLSPDGDGFQDVLIIQYQMPGNDYVCTLKVFDLNGRQIRHVLNNQSLATNGQLIWDGLTEGGDHPDSGIYIVSVDAFSPSQQRLSKQITVVVCYPK